MADVWFLGRDGWRFEVGGTSFLARLESYRFDRPHDFTIGADRRTHVERARRLVVEAEAEAEVLVAVPNPPEALLSRARPAMSGEHAPGRLVVADTEADAILADFPDARLVGWHPTIVAGPPMFRFRATYPFSGTFRLGDEEWVRFRPGADPTFI